ncbi:hypothetical protein diail_3920 [Diaporthe ilicicola]|nr:hypothetical protein diail_3920 [Diaporthe ilicicola]
MPSYVALGLVALAVVYGFLWFLLHLTQDAKEPPCMSTSLPFIGPVLAMGRHKTGFHRYIRDMYGSPIYTIRLPGARLYVVNSTALLPAVQRLYRTISFAAIEARAADTLMPLTKAANGVIQKGLMEDESYTMSFERAIHPATAPGQSLDAMNRISVHSLASSLHKMQHGREKSVELFEWVRHEIVMATTDAVYGPHNPFRDPDIEKAWYRFEPKIILFALGLPPNIFARDAVRARQVVHTAFTRYFKAGYHNEGSALVKSRYDHSVRFGFSMEDVAACEIGGLFAVIGSTAPASFWLIYHLYSDPVVLEDCRKELASLVRVTNSVQNGSKDMQGNDSMKELPCASIDITDVKTTCPVLISTFQEVLRLRHIGVSARVVLKDEQILDGTYRLKKGSVVMLPNPVFHSEPGAWGPTVSSFDHRRFIPREAHQDSNRSYKKQPKSEETGRISLKDRAAFRPWGGGHVLCPGRHFATTEILSFAALMILQFDIVPSEGHEWREPTVENTPTAAAMPLPDDPIPVDIRARQPCYRWRVELTDSDKAVGVGIEDEEY